MELSDTERNELGCLAWYRRFGRGGICPMPGCTEAGQQDMFPFCKTHSERWEYLTEKQYGAMPARGACES